VLLILAVMAIAGVWGAEQGGVRTSLSVQDAEIALGEPLVFRLEMENVGERVVKYDPAQVALNSSMAIAGSDGAQIPYIAMRAQTGGGSWPLEPGERRVLFETLDIADQYLITSPGTYTVRFKGQNAIPASNPVTIRVAEGTLRPSRVIAKRLFDAAQGSGWEVGIVEEGNVLPLGRTAVFGTALALRRAGWGLDRSLLVWVTGRPSVPQTAESMEAWQVSEPLGPSPSGDVYWWSRKVPEEELKTARTLLVTALKIEPVRP